jgi:flagellar hook protein FlgE
MSFQQGLSGLSAASKNLEVIGNNISNANTIGSKSSRAEFSDLYSSAAGGGGSVGIGTRVSAVTQDHSQGSITTTGNNLDLAINGGGYFQVADLSQAAAGGDTPVMYSRNGQFKSDRLGNIITNDGLRLLGYKAEDGVITAAGKPVPLTVPDAVLPPEPTTTIGLEINLDAADPAPIAAFSDIDETTYNYSSTLKVFDNAGQSVELEYYFRKVAGAANTWEVHITTPDPVDQTKNVKVATTPALPTLVFTEDGNGLTPAAVNPVVIDGATFSTLLNGREALRNGGAGSGITYKFGGVADPTAVPPVEQQIAINFGPDAERGLKGATQRAGDYAITNRIDDGYARGTLTGFSFDKEGILTAEYSNGKSQQTAQVVLTSFRNPQGLMSMGGNVWAEGPDVGAKTTGVPGSGNLGEISAGALEESNVDLTAALVSLITAQRTYQANAQTIKTQDQVLQTFVNMR